MEEVRCHQTVIMLISGFQAGNHFVPNAWARTAFADYHVVSIGYRYIPEVAFADQVQDCLDAYEWVKQHLHEHVNGVDVGRFTVMGDSAGGTFTLLMGFMLRPAPRAIVNLYGVTDFTYTHFGKPSEKPPTFELTPEKEAAIKDLLANHHPSQAKVTRLWRWESEPELPLETLRSYWGVPDYTPDSDAALQLDAYEYMGLKGIRMDVVFRKDEADLEAFERRKSEASALYLLQKTGQTLPPTYILHGTGDSVVPVSQGKRLEEELKSKGVAVQAHYPEGEEHAFDQRIRVSVCV